MQQMTRTSKSRPAGRPHAELDLEHFLPYRLSVLSNRISGAIAREYSTRFALTVTEWLRINVIPVTHRTSCHVQSGHGGSLPGMSVTTSL